jgi:hypothetical protein
LVEPFPFAVCYLRVSGPNVFGRELGEAPMAEAIDMGLEMRQRCKRHPVNEKYKE